MSFLIPSPRRVARVTLQLSVPLAIGSMMVAAGPVATAAFFGSAVATFGYTTVVATSLFVYYGGVSAVIGLVL